MPKKKAVKKKVAPKHRRTAKPKPRKRSAREKVGPARTYATEPHPEVDNKGALE